MHFLDGIAGSAAKSSFVDWVTPNLQLERLAPERAEAIDFSQNISSRLEFLSIGIDASLGPWHCNSKQVVCRNSE